MSNQALVSGVAYFAPPKDTSKIGLSGSACVANSRFVAGAISPKVNDWLDRLGSDWSVNAEILWQMLLYPLTKERPTVVLFLALPPG